MDLGQLLTPAKVLVTGASGQAGAAVCQQLADDPFFELVPLSRQQLDITSPEAVGAALQEHQPSFVVNCAGITRFSSLDDVSRRAYAVNADGTGHLASACQALQIPLLHLSSDAVFDNHYASGYTEQDEVAPQGVYGESFWQGEERVRASLEQHIILRVSWLFSACGNNFLTQTVKAARTEESLEAFSDHIGCPTSARDVARVVSAIIKQISNGAQAWGTYHYCGAEIISSYDFCKEILIAASEYENFKVEKLIALLADEDQQEDSLPGSSVLICKKVLNIFGIRQRPWRQELKSEMRALYQLYQGGTQP